MRTPKTRGPRSLAMLLTAFALCMLGTALASADVVRVPEDYPTFRQGLAATAPGETLLVGEGYYDEPGGPAWISPGVTIIGAGWAPPLQGTRLYNIELFFLAGSDSAIVQDLGIAHRRVSSDNSLGVVRRCLFGEGVWEPYFQDGYLAYVRGGLIVEDCFINCHIALEPHHYFYIQGGSFIMRNCIVAIQTADHMMRIHDIGPYPITLVDIRDNTFYAVGALRFIIDGSTPIPGPITFTNNIFQAQAGALDINDCSVGAKVSIEYNAFSTAPNSQCGPPSDTNVIGDPLMCNPNYYYWPPGPIFEDFDLHLDSPCVGAGVNGTTIGAREIGCGLSTAVDGNPTPSLAELRIDVSPNPFVRGGSLVIESQDAGPGFLRLYDSTGRLKAHRLVGVEHGEAMVNLDRALGISLSRGVHYLELTQGTRRAVRKVVVLP